MGVFQMYQGESRLLYITIKDSNGVIISPLTFKRVEIRLINEYTFETLVKWWVTIGTAPPSGQSWNTGFTILANKIELAINSSYTKDVSLSHIRVQVNIVTTDTDFENNEKVLIFSSVLARLLKAKQ